jgi:P27 family predicted phage terminase small subunit
MAGRKPVPTKLKVLKGTQRADRFNPDEPMPDPNIPEAPDHLSKHALIEWGRITSHLSKLGLVSDLDMTALAMYCQAWGRIVKYEKIVEKAGELYKTDNGNFQLSPAMWVINKAYDQCYKLLGEFGMSPASRSKVSAKKEEKKSDPWTKFGANG